MRLPSLNALHAFEAAARHQSFARAANELHVSQGAISRHVKLLEEDLGVALFRRLPRGIELTAQGQALLPELTAAFQRIRRAAQDIAEHTRDLRVASPPTLAARWLVRRLSAFRDLRPDMHVSLSLMCGHDEFLRGGFDLGIVDHETNRTRPPGLEAVLLRQEALAPVCAPALLEGIRGGSGTTGSLKRQTLLHPNPDRQDWRKWLRAAGMQEHLAEGGHLFDTLEMAIAAAIGGLGVAMVDLELIRDELAVGALAVPFEFVLQDGTGYYLIARHGRLDEPKVAAFSHWLLAEAAAGQGRP